MLGKENSGALSMGMHTVEATVEKSLEYLQKTKFELNKTKKTKEKLNKN